MGWQFLKTGFRSLARHRSFSIISISGLAIGIAAAILVFTVVKYELGYDAMQPDFNRLYRVVTEDRFEGGNTYNPGLPTPAFDALRTDYPEIKFGALQAVFNGQITVLGNDKSFNANNKKFIEQNGVFFASPEFFDIFKVNWLSGNASVLSAPNQTVLSRSMAEKYFGNWNDAVGKFLQLDNLVTVRVAGIIENIQSNTDFPLDVVTSLETAKANAGAYSYSNDWGSVSSNFQIFAKLPTGKDAQWLNNQLKDFVHKHYPENKESRRIHFLQPLNDLHFDNRFSIFGDHITSRNTLLTLSLIGLFIVIMACINFINLSTAQATMRSKEIGVRKVLGSSRVALFFQVIAETAFTVAIAVVLALLIATICLPYIKDIALIKDDLSLFNGDSLLFLILLCITVIFLAGSYPALILSGFKPIQALKNKITASTVAGVSLRRALVVLQFAIAQMLIIATIIAVSQMNFVNSADLGFNREAVFLLSANSDSVVQSRQEAFKQKLLTLPAVKSVSLTADAPSSQNGWLTNFKYDHRPPEKFQVSLKFADRDYFKTFGIQFLAGRGYSQSDTINEIVINETLLHQLNEKNPEEAIGKQIALGRSSWKTIVGVVKDFKTNSLRESVKPTILLQFRPYYGITAIKLHTPDLAKSQAQIESIWNQYFPEYAFTTSYMEDNINQFYLQENNLALLYKIFAGLAIFISCLGLYGLVSFMAVQRLKEIGIRKVLGASVQNILLLFSKEFTILIISAAVIAIPVSYYFMNQWLLNFTFRIELQPLVFISAVLVSVFVAWIAVGYKSIRAAIANPIKSLRSE